MIYVDVIVSTTYFRLVSSHQTQVDLLIFFWWRTGCRVIFIPSNI